MSVPESEPPVPHGNLLPGDGPLRLKLCRRGPMLYNMNDTNVAELLDLYGEYSEQELRLFERILSPGQVAVDAGANIGAFTVPFAKFVGPAGHVHAFEPQPHVWRTLVANTALNGLDNVTCWHAAVGAAPGEIRVPDRDSGQAYNWGGLSLVLRTDGTQGTPVRLMTIDELDLPACRFIKSDTEGMDIHVVRGAADTIRRCQPVLYLEADYAHLVPPILDLVRSLGYTPYWHLTYYARADNHDGRPLDGRWVRMGTMNLLCGPRRMHITDLPEAKTGDWRADCGVPAP